VAAGANRDSVIVSHVQGAHPGGTAAIGELVDTDLQTAVEGLFVADGSVSGAPGLHPCDDWRAGAPTWKKLATA